MGNLGGGEILVILLVALIVLGPTKLPPAVRQVGKFVGEIRRIGQGFQQELREAAQPLAEATETIKAANPRKVIEPPPADKKEGTAASGKGGAASGPASWGTAAAGAPLAAKSDDTGEEAGALPAAGSEEVEALPAAGSEEAGALPAAGSEEAGALPAAGSEDPETAAAGTPSADGRNAAGSEAAEQDPESRDADTA